MFQEITEKLFKNHGYGGEEWAMTFAEKFALTGILSERKPSVSIEVGTLKGGSLSIISQYSEKVYSIDPDPTVRERLERKYRNVEFVTGYSQEVLPGIVRGLNENEEELGFVLIDGDHTEDGVRKDIEEILKYTPRAPLWILMHDSFNPDCRRAMKSIEWEANGFVHWVNYDFIPGFLSSIPDWEDQMWCGMALAYLDKEMRVGELPIGELLGRQFSKVFPISTHFKEGT